MPQTVTELWANSPQAVLGAAVLTAPAAGTVETWTVTVQAPGSGQDVWPTLTPGSQMRVLVNSEIVLVTAGITTAGTRTWTVTRGAEGAITTHANGTALALEVTKGSLARMAQPHPAVDHVSAGLGLWTSLTSLNVVVTADPSGRLSTGAGVPAYTAVAWKNGIRYTTSADSGNLLVATGLGVVNSISVDPATWTYHISTSGFTSGDIPLYRITNTSLTAAPTGIDCHWQIDTMMPHTRAHNAEDQGVPHAPGSFSRYGNVIGRRFQHDIGLPDTTEGVHLGQVFEYNVPVTGSGATAFTAPTVGLTEYLWGAQQSGGGENLVPIVTNDGAWREFYNPWSELNSNSATTAYSTAWLKNNHPEWICFKTDKVTPGYGFAKNQPGGGFSGADGTGTPPVDLANPAAASFLVTTILNPALKNGFDGISFDGSSQTNSHLVVGNYATAAATVAAGSSGTKLYVTSTAPFTSGVSVIACGTASTWTVGLTVNSIGSDGGGPFVTLSGSINATTPTAGQWVGIWQARWAGTYNDVLWSKDQATGTRLVYTAVKAAYPQASITMNQWVAPEANDSSTYFDHVAGIDVYFDEEGIWNEGHSTTPYIYNLTSLAQGPYPFADTGWLHVMQHWRALQRDYGLGLIMNNSLLWFNNIAISGLGTYGPTDMTNANWTTLIQAPSAPTQGTGVVDIGTHQFGYSWLIGGYETPIGPVTSVVVASTTKNLTFTFPTSGYPSGIQGIRLYKRLVGATTMPWYYVTQATVSGQTATPLTFAYNQADSGVTGNQSGRGAATVLEWKDTLQYVLCCYLLIKYHHTFLAITGVSGIGGSGTYGTPPPWCTDFSVDLGTPIGDFYLSQSVYWRQFTKGLVVVNPDKSSDFTVTLPSTITGTSGLQTGMYYRYDDPAKGLITSFTLKHPFNTNPANTGSYPGSAWAMIFLRGTPA